MRCCRISTIPLCNRPSSRRSARSAPRPLRRCRGCWKSPKRATSGRRSFRSSPASGHGAKAALPMIYAAAKDYAPDVRASAVTALASVEPDDAKALAVLVPLAGECPNPARCAARPRMRSAKYGPAASAAVPGLITMLDKETERGEVMRTLKSIGVKNVPDLLTMLAKGDDPHTDFCLRIARQPRPGGEGRRAEAARDRRAGWPAARLGHRRRSRRSIPRGLSERISLAFRPVGMFGDVHRAASLSSANSTTPRLILWCYAIWRTPSSSSATSDPSLDAVAHARSGPQRDSIGFGLAAEHAGGHRRVPARMDGASSGSFSCHSVSRVSRRW